jgi:terminase small subunit / prophage DNA-packing protein
LATRKELAEHLDLSPQSISDLIGKGIFTIGSGRSPVNIDVCRIQYINHIRKSARYTRKDGTGDIAEEKTKLTAAQARKAELEVEEMEAKLIPAELVQETWIDYVANARAKLLGLPSRIAHQVITVDKYAEAELIIKEQVHEALNELAQDGIPQKYRKGDTGDKPSMDSTTESED